MEQYTLKLLQEKGGKAVQSDIKGLIGMLILIVMISALAGDIFGNLNLLGAETPTWVKSILIVGAGALLVFMLVKKLE